MNPDATFVERYATTILVTAVALAVAALVMLGQVHLFQPILAALK